MKNGLANLVVTGAFVIMFTIMVKLGSFEAMVTIGLSMLLAEHIVRK